MPAEHGGGLAGTNGDWPTASAGMPSAVRVRNSRGMPVLARSATRW